MWDSTLSLLIYSLYLHIVVSPCKPLLCPYYFTHYIYILYSVHVSLYSAPIVFTEVIVQWVQKVKLNVIAWKDSLENDAAVSQTFFQNHFYLLFHLGSSIWHPHLKNVKSRIKKILKRVYFKGPISKIGAWLFWE